MQYHIHTIPVLDALKESENRCPFCVMKDKLERDAINFIMGPAYMEDDIRMETNELGFCAAHLEKLYGEQNRLGLALMLHTFMQRLNKDVTAASKSPLPRFGKKKDDKLRNHFKTQNTCYLCRMIDNTFERYIGTYLYLWGKSGEESRLIEAVPGYCLPHFSKLLDASASLSGSKQERFKKIIDSQIEFMKQLEDDLEWFTLKFDYRNVNEPWKNAKDALPRALGILGAKNDPVTPTKEA
jgi:hypothetical protein